MKSSDDSPVELRCALAVVRSSWLLLVQHHEHGDWMLPGRRPQSYETMGACARHMVREETGLDVQPAGPAPVAEVIDHHTRTVVELVFVADDFDRQTAATGEQSRQPRWVPREELKGATLHPPIATRRAELSRRFGPSARYLGSLRRPAGTEL